MNLETELRLTLDFSNPPALEHFAKYLDLDWVKAVLEKTGVATIRKRRISVEQAVWIVLAIGMFRDRPIFDVVDKLDLVLPDKADKPIAPSAISQARERLGVEPMEQLFKETSAKWGLASAKKHLWNGFELFGIDGSSLRVWDEPGIREHFGCQKSGNGVESSYPLVRVVTLMALRSHLLVDAAFGPYKTHEQDYARELFERIPGKSLTILDRGFLGAPMLLAIENQDEERHWLTRAKSTTKWKVLETFGENDLLVEMKVSRNARTKDPSLPKTFVARGVHYHFEGFEPTWLLTSLRDPKQFPAAELIELYHERWELELGYDELKTELLDREETLRSRSVSGIQQELWGVLTSYNLIRLEMESIADEVRVEPQRISFVGALRLITDEWMWCAAARSPGIIPKNLARLRTNLKRFVLPARRTRTYPRAVKLRTSHYPKKKRPAAALLN